METILFHIRRRLPPLKGNMWYKDKRIRHTETYCKASVTEHDVEWRSKAVPFNSRVPCPECLKIRAQEKTI